MVPTDYELLEDTYVQLEISDTGTNLSILRSIDKLFELIQEQSYSLLNWKSYKRSKDAVAPKYDRILHFGRWITPYAGDCHNTRAIVLMRDSVKKVKFLAEDPCTVDTGRWKDDFTGKVFLNRLDIQIDHLVPLKNAYISGSYKWNAKARCLYANYLGNNFHLKSVNATENMKKGDRTPEGYMPPYAVHSCKYLKNWLTTKFLWGLKMTISEADAIKRLIKENNCDRSSFKISDNEILKQNRFAVSSLSLCENADSSQNP